LWKELDLSSDDDEGYGGKFRCSDIYRKLPTYCTYSLLCVTLSRKKVGDWSVEHEQKRKIGWNSKSHFPFYLIAAAINSKRKSLLKPVDLEYTCLVVVTVKKEDSLVFINIEVISAQREMEQSNSIIFYYIIFYSRIWGKVMICFNALFSEYNE